MMQRVCIIDSEMKILVTGFDAFGGEAMNPAFEAVRRLPDVILGAQIIKLEIPTSFHRSAQVVQEAIETDRPDAVLHVGQAGGRHFVTVEQVAINLMEATLPDNDGDAPIGQPVVVGGDTAFFTTLPIKAMVFRMGEGGILADISYTAGTYVCNSIMYHSLYLQKLQYPTMRAGFIHVPFADEQITEEREGMPSLPIDEMARALELAIEAIILNDSDIEAAAGAIQ